jgi:hypothetical protein
LRPVIYVLSVAGAQNAPALIQARWSIAVSPENGHPLPWQIIEEVNCERICPVWRRIRSDMTQQDEERAYQRVGGSKQSNQNRETSHNMAAGKQTKRRYNQGDYE